MTILWSAFTIIAAVVSWMLLGLFFVNAAESLFSKYRQWFNHRFNTFLPLSCEMFDDLCSDKNFPSYADSSRNRIFSFGTLVELLWPVPFLFLLSLITWNVATDIAYMRKSRRNPAEFSKKPDHTDDDKKEANQNPTNREGDVVGSLGNAGQDQHSPQNGASDATQN